MMLCATSLACIAMVQLDVAREQLFIEWTTSSTIAKVTLGLPTENEADEVANLLQEVRGLVRSGEQGTLSVLQQDSELPFLLAMLDGIAMVNDARIAEDCLRHANILDVRYEGIAGSRILRMQMRASQIVGNEANASSFADALRLFEDAHLEDLTALRLYDIEMALRNSDTQRAHKLFRSFDNMLCANQGQHLRLPFAQGYAKIAPSQEDAMFGWFTLADWLVEYGYNQKDVDALVLDWVARLQPQVEVSEGSAIPCIALLAKRLNATTTIKKASAELEVIHKLIREHQYDEAMQLLRPLAQGNGALHQQAITLLCNLENMAFVPLDAAFAYDNALELPTRLAKEYSSAVVQQLLHQAIERSHMRGLDPWTESAFKVLVQRNNLVSPGTLAESYRLLGNYERAIVLFKESIEFNGESIQSVAGLADCTRDEEAMQKVVGSTKPDDASAYWYWLANVRVLQWYVADGGNPAEVTAKINRLRKKDASLGGAQFMSQFNALLFKAYQR